MSETKEKMDIVDMFGQEVNDSIEKLGKKEELNVICISSSQNVENNSLGVNINGDTEELMLTICMVLENDDETNNLLISSVGSYLSHPDNADEKMKFLSILAMASGKGFEKKDVKVVE